MDLVIWKVLLTLGFGDGWRTVVFGSRCAAISLACVVMGTRRSHGHIDADVMSAMG